MINRCDIHPLIIILEYLRTNWLLVKITKRSYNELIYSLARVPWCSTRSHELSCILVMRLVHSLDHQSRSQVDPKRS